MSEHACKGIACGHWPLKAQQRLCTHTHRINGGRRAFQKRIVRRESLLQHALVAANGARDVSEIGKHDQRVLVDQRVLASMLRGRECCWEEV